MAPSKYSLNISRLLHALHLKLRNKHELTYDIVENMSNTKNNDGLHFCITEIYVSQEYFRMCYIRRQLMFCCDLVVDDDVRR